MLGDCTVNTKMNNGNSNDKYATSNSEMEPKCFISWSPLEENRFLYKHTYVSCSRSVPHRNRHFVQYRISRSLNFDTSVHSSSSDNSYSEDDKHLSRAAKIMRALNCNSSSPSYGKTKIKKSLNFNLTPSPKRFMPVRKNIRKSLSLNFNSPLSASKKSLHFDDCPRSSTNSKLLFSSSESIDENQNQTPSQQNRKDREVLWNSTPNTSLTRKILSPGSFTPLSHSRLKKTTNNIIYINTTPPYQAVEDGKKRSKCTNGIANMSRNLFYEFDDKEDDRPCTPENEIHIIPESMSAIKKSHKKERTSRQKEYCALQFERDTVGFENILTQFRKHSDRMQDCELNESLESNKLALNVSEDNMSDTGSIFDYTNENEYILKEDKAEFSQERNYRNVPGICNLRTKEKLQESIEMLSEEEISDANVSNEDCNNSDKSDFREEVIDVATKARTITPEPQSEFESYNPVTPENHINILQRIAFDSIKKSHKKTKDINKKRFFSPKVLQNKTKVAEEQENIQGWDNLEQNEDNKEVRTLTEQGCLDASRADQVCTPDKLNSSRLLVSQFSSVKKSHKKDKNNKILSGFLKRQEFFTKDLHSAKSNRYKPFTTSDVSEYKNSTDLSSDPSVIHADTNTSLEKLSPTKRKVIQNESQDCETSSDSELREFNKLTEEFQIFTPLKRKKPILMSGGEKEYLNFYNVPSDKYEDSDDAMLNISCSQCTTPIPKFQSEDTDTEETDNAKIKCNGNVSSDEAGKVHEYDTNDVTGRSTPKNMSTAELYCNLDSIKKSHKKNKRGLSSSKRLNLAKERSYLARADDTSTENIENEMCNKLDFSSDCDATNEINRMCETSSDRSIDDGNTSSGSISPAMSSENQRNTTNLISSNITPPHCLKTKTYMNLLMETSIKRSHKKVKDLKKQNYMFTACELSDDGSIFDAEEKAELIEDQHDSK